MGSTWPLEGRAEQVANLMKTVRGITDLGIFRVVGQPNDNFEVDRQAAARYQLSVADVQDILLLERDQIAFGDGEIYKQIVKLAPGTVLQLFLHGYRIHLGGPAWMRTGPAHDSLRRSGAVAASISWRWCTSSACLRHFRSFECALDHPSPLERVASLRRSLRLGEIATRIFRD
jgi:hypothetical protein